MKKFIFILFAVMTFTGANAQKEDQSNNDSMNTLFGHNQQHIGWWVSPDFAWTRIDSRDAYLGGLSGGIIINHELSIGLAGYGLMNSQNFKYSGVLAFNDVYLYGGYGGLKLEYRFFPLNVINVGIPLLIGGGALTYSTWGPDSWHHNQSNVDYLYVWDGYFVIEPGVVVGINILKFMRLDAGVSYRYASGISLPNTDSNLMNSFSANLSLKFGKF